MKTKKVIVHKMYEDFHTLPIIQYSGQFNDSNLMIKLFNNLNQELTHIRGTLQWKLASTGDVYFVENDYEFFHKIQ